MAGGWKSSLASILKESNGVKEGGSVASFATQDKRSDILFAGFTELRELGYKLDSVEQFKERHMSALGAAWEKRELAPSTIQDRISTFRTFSEWIGKEGMIRAADNYVSGEGAASRTSINTQDKSWGAKDLDVVQKIAEVKAIDERVALQLELQQVFGLRVREALELRPALSDKGTYLAVNVGTKGGRDRTVPINTPEKRELLDRAKTFASNISSTSDQKKSLAQVKNNYYAVMRQAGITKADAGISSHGLRHAYANDRYKEITGVASPVRGGGFVEKSLDNQARLIISEELGHSRENVTTHYLGR